MANWNIEEFRSVYKEWKKSGLSIRDFSTSIGIKEDKFYYWQKKMHDIDSVPTSSKGSFVELPHSSNRRPNEGSIRAGVGKTTALCELVYPNGVVVRITSDLSLDGLRQLINLEG